MKKRTKLTEAITFLVIIIVTPLLTQCKKEDVDVLDCSGNTPTYTTNVKSILDTKCIGCHNANNNKGGYNLSDYENSKQAGSLKAFLGAIQHKSGYSKMPRGGSKLSDADVKTITCWVQNGMPQ